MADDDAAQVYEKLKALGVFSEVKPQGPPVSGIQIPKPLRDSQERNARNLQLALENQAYYLEQAKKTGKAWHLHPKSTDQYSEWVMISPEMAEVIYDNYNVAGDRPNRNIKVTSAEGYARDVEHGRWIPTAESIMIDVEGNCNNGQHRLLSLIMTKKSNYYWVTFNVSVESRFGLDQGVPRSPSEKVGVVMENKIGERLPAIARAMMRGISKDKVKFTQAEITEFCLQHHDVIEWAAKSCKGYRADVVAVIAKATLWHGKEALAPFCERLVTYTWGKDIDDPAKRLWRFVTAKHPIERGRGGIALVTYKKTITAVNAFIKKRPVKNLTESAEDIFEWVGDNWQLPEKK